MMGIEGSLDGESVDFEDRERKRAGVVQGTARGITSSMLPSKGNDAIWQIYFQNGGGVYKIDFTGRWQGVEEVNYTLVSTWSSSLVPG